MRGTVEQTFDPVGSSVGAARGFVVEQLVAHGADADLADDFSLAVSELASNVVQHGGGANITVRVQLTDPRWWEVSVGGGRAWGDGARDPSAWTIAPPTKRTGRGLGIVRALMDDVLVEEHDDVLSIRCRRRRVA